MEIPKLCFIKKDEKGLVGVYVALKIKRRPQKESNTIKKKYIKSKDFIGVRLLLFICFPSV
jgi:hypothetical protein